MGSHSAATGIARLPVAVLSSARLIPIASNPAGQPDSVVVFGDSKRRSSIDHRRSAGTPDSFDAYYRRDYRKLVGLAYVLTGSQWLAEDLVQDALTEAHRKWATVQHYDDPAGWVRRVMINKSASRIRRLRTESRGLLRIGARRSETIAPADTSLEVWEAVRSLPVRQAQVVALFYWEDRPLREIAEILGVSFETAKTHLKRGRATLAEQLDSHRGEFT